MDISVRAFFESQLIAAMQAYHIPVISYAVINNFAVEYQNILSVDDNISISLTSLFQSASISKMLSSIGVLKLVENGLLNLDDPANKYIKDWQIPENKFTKKNPVLVKHLLNMTSGLSISNFEGYKQNEKLPNLLELLQGKKPANNVPVEVLYEPGSKYSYSNGGFQVLQKVIEDLSSESFQDYQNKILRELKMQNSIYEFPLSDELAVKVIPGYLNKDNQVIDGWHNYAGLAACGMWSTPIDIATFMLNLTNSFLGKEPHFLSNQLAAEMLTRNEKTSFGLGAVISGHDNSLNFAKTGHTLGYQSFAIMFPKLGKGAVIMTNSESGDILINYFIALVALKYSWPYYFPFFDESICLTDY